MELTLLAVELHVSLACDSDKLKESWQEQEELRLGGAPHQHGKPGHRRCMPEPRSARHPPCLPERENTVAASLRTHRSQAHFSWGQLPCDSDPSYLEWGQTSEVKGLVL